MTMPITTQGRADSVDVAIVGAGSAGLAAARYLVADPALHVVVLEAGNRTGGRAHTIEAGSPACPIDLGCAWLHGSQTNAWRHIAEDLGYDIDRRPAPWDHWPSGLGLSEEEGADYVATVEAFYAKAEAVGAAGQTVALAELVKPGNRWRGLMDFVSTCVSGAELALVSVEDQAQYQPGPGQDWRILAGYGRLVRDFGAPLPVRLETPVRGIDHRGAEHIRVETDSGTLSARTVIVTVSTNVLARELIRFTPALPAKVEAARCLPLGLDNKVYFGVDAAAGLPADDYWVGDNQSSHTMAYHVRHLGRPVIEAFYGGALARELEAAGPQAAEAFALQEMVAHYGASIRPYLTTLAVTEWGREPFILGSYAYAMPGTTGCRAQLAAPIDNRLLFAGEACAPHAFSTAHGAYETGVAAAKAAMTYLYGR